MKILAVEFSSEERSVALVEDLAILARASEHGGRRAIGLIDEVLRAAHLEREATQTIAVGIGPGSYTGIRSAIALAQGFQLALDVRLLGISSVECIAEHARRNALRGTVHVIVDAQRNEFYLATYDLDALAAVEKSPLRLAPFAEIEALSRAGQTVLGPDIRQYFPRAQDAFPDAATLGLLAVGRDNYVAGENLEPIYLRQPAFKKSPPWRTVAG